MVVVFEFRFVEVGRDHKQISCVQGGDDIEILRRCAD